MPPRGEQRALAGEQREAGGGEERAPREAPRRRRPRREAPDLPRGELQASHEEAPKPLVAPPDLARTAARGEETHQHEPVDHGGVRALAAHAMTPDLGQGANSAM